MKPAPFKAATHTLDPPLGSDLPAMPTLIDEEGHTMTSCWQPSVAELAALAAGGRVFLTVHCKEVHPIVSLGVK